MNKTALAFNMTNNTTIETKGTKTIAIASTGHKNSNFTVVLACLADGTKLSSVIIFKLVNVPCEEFPDSVVVHANPSGWMNENEMFGNNLRSLLILDSFTDHKTDLIKCYFCEKHTDLALIPNSLTPRLQPLDVSLNKSFKVK
ncbi:2047_t:CDS:2, partial [Cetraspora pellucida]